MSTSVAQTDRSGKEHQPQNSTNLRAWEETRLIESTSTKRIVEGDLKLLRQALKYGMLKVGLRLANIPEEEEFSVLMSHVIINYGMHTPDEVKLAFDLALSEQLDLEQKDISCYENFSCLYISSILNSYRRWKSKTVEKINREPKIQKENLLPPVETHWGGDVNKYFGYVKRGEYLNYIFYPVGLYMQMVKDGFIQHNPLYTEEQKKKAVYEQFVTDKDRREVYYERG